MNSSEGRRDIKSEVLSRLPSEQVWLQLVPGPNGAVSRQLSRMVRTPKQDAHCVTPHGKGLDSAHCITMTFALKRLRARMLGPLSSR